MSPALTAVSGTLTFEPSSRTFEATIGRMADAQRSRPPGLSSARRRS